MAKFCSSCGSPVGDNQKFCGKCGSPAGASTTSPATPVAVAPVAAAPKKGSSAVKIIVAIVGLLALVSVLAIGSCFYIGYKIKQKANSIMMNSRAAASSAPDMHLSEGGPGSTAAAAATVDVPPYPGSTPTASGGQLSAGPTGSASAQEYLTDDSVDKVESFYKDKFGSKINIMESEGKVVFNYLTSMGMTTVTLTPDQGTGKTKINIARIGK
ncbi:MAG TPA: zinc ribbon domain-containing protein [Terriglobia bacterium]|nr:zinc ribbon domain-containing protein [Terriglobia bacterium]